ncbi:hypothetical protein ACLMJK_001385 [Lecanora helva]
MPVTADPSPFTSVTASPMESHAPDELPIELKVPLPSSSTCSDHDEAKEKVVADPVIGYPEGQKEDLHSNRTETDKAGKPEDNIDEIRQPEDSFVDPSVTLEELTQLLDLETYEKYQALSSQTRLEQLQLSCGLHRRLISTLSIAYGNMIDQYKTDDQAGFAGLYEACEQLKSSCEVKSSPRIGLSQSHKVDREDSTLVPGIQTLSSKEQDSMLAFITRLRTEPTFMSERISELSSTEFTALTSSYHPAGIDFSILQNHSHGKSQFFSKDSQMMKLSRRMDNLHWFHNRDPFFAMLYGIFDCAAKPGTCEYTRRIEIWSAICTKTMLQGFAGSRPGSDELAIASMDAFANVQDWPLKSKIEVYLMGILAKGVPILEPAISSSSDVKEPPETHNAKAAIAETDFFEDALTDLFDFLTRGNVQQAVPPGALSFAHGVLRRIEDPKLRVRAQQFIVIRWYFATLMSSILVYPEVCGVMMTQHIGETARRLILQKLVVKMQERVFDVVLPWNNNAFANPMQQDKIMAIFQLFTPPMPIEENGLEAPDITEDNDASSRFLMLTPLDVVGVVQVLCPETMSFQGPATSISAVPLSAPPSTAGSSTLVAGSSDIGSIITGSATHPGPRDSDPGESSKLEAKIGQSASYDVLEGEVDPKADTAKGPNKDVDHNLGMTCHKLREASKWDPRAPSQSHSNLWTFFYYSKDSLKLSMRPLGTKSPGAISEGPEVSTDAGGKSDKSAVDGSYQFLKAVIIDLVSGIGEAGGTASKDLGLTQPNKQHNPSKVLEALMRAAVASAELKLDFRSSQIWSRNLQTYKHFLAQNSTKAVLTLLDDVKKDLQNAIDRAASVAQHCINQAGSLTKMQNHQKNVLLRLEELRQALRVKMWYASDVRHSSPYEEAIYVTRALRAMANSKRFKQPSSISSWARQRLRGTNIHNRAEAQTLDAMIASKEYGGISKLADEQIEMTSRWLTRKSIENFCKGEERIHRFCFEIQRSVGKIAGPSLMESPVLWSSNLFKRERASFDVQRARSYDLDSPIPSLYSAPMTSIPGRLHTPVLSAPPALSFRTGSGPSPRSPLNPLGGFWNPTQPLRQSTGLGLYSHQPILPPTPTSPPTSWLSSPYGPTPTGPSGPPVTHSPSLSSGPQFGSNHSRENSEGEVSPERKAFAENARRRLCSLLVSDLGYMLWNTGSETDVWFNDHVLHDKAGNTVPRAVHTTSTSIHHTTESTQTGQDIISGSGGVSCPGTASSAIPSERGKEPVTESPSTMFSYSEAFATLIRQMSLIHDPFSKLRLLAELEGLIISSMDTSYDFKPGEVHSAHPTHLYGHASLRSRSVPRTKATSLEEVIANCTERRAGTLKSQVLQPASLHSIFGAVDIEPNIVGADEIVNAFYSIFRDPNLRSNTLFRDLQYIAAFVPAEILDKTAQGKAFWDAGIAALALKEDLCHSMIDRASAITAYHISPHPAATSAPLADNTLASTTLRDAANLWLIAAKEGSPVAARELGLFYLTHPELIPRITMPFSKAKDVFKAVAAHDNPSGAGNKDKGALDPYTFAVVFHWMDIAANGGDKDAKDFLKGNGELSGGKF